MQFIGRAEFCGWPDCIVVESGETKCVVTTNVGPRIVWIGHSGDYINLGSNIFGGFADQMGKSGEKDFRFRMGDRFWLGPEVNGPKTYDPDNFPSMSVAMHSDCVIVTQNPGFGGLQKTIKVQARQHYYGGVVVERRLKNMGTEKINEVALWGLSGMALNGTAIIPRPPFQYHPAFSKKGAKPEQIGGFASIQNMAFWPYTNLRDPRLTFGQKYILLHQDPSVNNENVNKFGLSDVPWVAYLVKTQAGARLFIKRLSFDQQRAYPDRGSVFETFVCAQFLELEELGPMENLDRGQEATPLITRWSVHKIGRMPGKLTDNWIDNNVLPLIK